MHRNLFHRQRETISRGLERYKPHRAQKYVAITVLLLTWKDTDLKLEDEWGSLQRMFQQDFNYQVQRYSIPSARSQIQLGLAVGAFLMEHGKPDHLIIVYYGGHGGPTRDGSTECEWWATGEENSASLDWAGIQPQLDAAECDVLILLDCCYAGQAVRSRNRHYVEILAATDKDQKTPIGFKKWPSFTNVLMKRMRRMIEEEQEINIRELHYQLAQASSGLRKQPFYASSTAKSMGQIILKKLPKTEPSSGLELLKSAKTFNTENQPPIFLEVFTYRPLDSTVLNSIVNWLTKDSPSSIMDVRLVEKVMTDASSFQSAGVRVLEEIENNDRGRSATESDHRDELTKRLLDLQRTLQAPSPLELTDKEAERLVDMMREKSRGIDIMIQDVLATLEQAQLQKLQSHQDITDNESIRNRIQMRLTIIGDADKSNTPLSSVEYIDPPTKLQRFRLGIQGDRRVLVEYWYYDEVQKDALEKAREQARRMSALLLEPKPDAFRSPPGVGYVHDQLYGPRFGFVYEIPDARNLGTYTVVSEAISQKGYVPLEERIHLCRILCEAMLQLHSVGWYHKAFHTRNILLFSNGDKTFPSYDFKRPYIIGYDCSRPSETETRQSIDFTFKENLYRHPDRWGKPESFRSYHDIYSFGILLLEIGCWRSLMQMDHQRKSFEYIKAPEVFREYLLSKAINLVAHYAGSRFADAVRVCLKKRNWERLDEWEVQQTVREEVLARLNMFP